MGVVRRICLEMIYHGNKPRIQRYAHTIDVSPWGVDEHHDTCGHHYVSYDERNSSYH